MKIGLANNNPDWGGGEQWFCDAAHALAARGHKLVLAAHKETELFKRFQTSGSPTFPFTALESGFFKACPDVVLCNSGGDLRDLLRQVPVPFHARFILRRGIDRPLRDNLFRRHCWRALSAILTNSDATRQTVLHSLPWFPSERVERIYNPVSIEIAPRVEANTSVFRLGACGRLVKQKGFDILLDAVAALGDEINWSLEIAGDGKLRNKLEARAARLGLGKRCRFLGHLEALPKFYARQDALIVPSRYEGFGFVAAEAALCGLPVIASRTSSLPEIVIDGETGILVPPQNATELARAIRELAQIRERAAHYGAKAARRARERFAPELLQDQLSAFLINCVHFPPVGESPPS